MSHLSNEFFVSSPAGAGPTNTCKKIVGLKTVSVEIKKTFELNVNLVAKIDIINKVFSLKNLNAHAMG